MTDDEPGRRYHPGRAKAGPLSAGAELPPDGPDAPATPAETGFPYIATQGIQAGPPAAPAATPDPGPRLRNRHPRRASMWLPVGIGVLAGLFVLAVLGAYLVWGPTGNPIAGPPTPTTPDATGSGAVRGYLQALAAGDADAALGFAATAPGDSTLLTDEMLQAAGAEAAITAIEVPDSADDVPRQQITVRYRQGDQTVSTSFEVVRRDSVWRLTRVAVPVDLTSLRLREVPLTINGIPVASSAPALFPGRYTVGAVADRYAVADPEFTVTAVTAPPQVPATRELSEAGRAEVAKAARAHLKACVKRRELNPAGCGFAIADPEGTKLKESTMRWSVDSGADGLDSLEVALDHPGSATAPVSIVVRGQVRGNDGSRWKASVRLTRVRADLTGEKVTVQFA